MFPPGEPADPLCGASLQYLPTGAGPGASRSGTKRQGIWESGVLQARQDRSCREMPAVGVQRPKDPKKDAPKSLRFWHVSRRGGKKIFTGSASKASAKKNYLPTVDRAACEKKIIYGRPAQLIAKKKLFTAGQRSACEKKLFTGLLHRLKIPKIIFRTDL